MFLETQAQVTTTVAPTTDVGTLGTHVSHPTHNIHTITGGTLVGSNLFHSFDQFNVGSGDIANFQNMRVNGAFPSVENILSRVTGGEPSQIYGTLRTTDFGNANLFLLNPNGILFGPTASLDIGAASQGPRGSGSFYATTADYLKMGDGASASRFYADEARPSILTSYPIVAFGFLGPTGGIVVEGSQLSVPDGQTLALIAGEIRIAAAETNQGVRHSAMLSAPSGRFDIASITTGEISAAMFQPSINGQLGPVSLVDGSVISVSHDAGAAGTVRIRAGQLVLDNATISADTGIRHGAPIAVDIVAADEFSITATTGSAITARSTGAGDAGTVEIVSGKLTVSATNPEPLRVIDTHTLGAGKAGNVNVIATEVTATGDSEGTTFFIDSGTTGDKPGGNVSITASNVTFESAYINTGDPNLSKASVLGSAGNIRIIGTDSINLNFSNLTSDSALGNAGDILLASQGQIGLEFSSVSATGFERSGAIEIRGDKVSMLDSHVESFLRGSPEVERGGVLLTGRFIELTEGSTITTTTLGNGNAGSIHVRATEQLNLVGTSTAGTTGIFSNSVGLNGNRGNGGNVFIDTSRLEITGGARINTATRTSGQGGNVIINASTISMAGQLVDPPSEGIFGLGNQLASGIFTSTIGTSQSCAGTCGSAGDVSTSTRTSSLFMSHGAQINSGTSSSGHGGIIDIRSTNTINLSGTSIDGTPSGIFSRTIGQASNSGAGGNIFLTAGQSVTIQDGATVSASSTGPGHAGKIDIDAGQQLLVQNSKITTEALQAKKGGDIKLVAIDRIHLANGEISTSVRGGHGSGGNITIDPKIVVLQNSQILAQAVRGKGGDITITTQMLMPDSVSRIDASTPFGLDGTVRIQAPYAPAGGKIQPLGNRPLQATSLLHQRCAAVVDGQFSSFTVAGRNSLSAEPGGWLSSPLALSISAPHGATPPGDTMTSKGPRASHEPTEEFPSLSLRQIAPPRFLTETFAMNRLGGCRS
ncbi:MAG: filamentous hemagglutinin N-terminal domain-containing protein [Nitrospira sp.]|nr:filamentous hemagglutinin N-terminal domain-containing protein [Nitrospira sp.]